MTLPEVRPETATRVVLIEGLPGTGKTSLAEWLCGWLADQGTTATWTREVEREHPVIDRSLMRTAREPGYADRCVERWRAFSRAVRTTPSPEVFVLEGCFFQSTVRFLVEHEHPSADALHYLAAAEAALAPLRPRLVYLTQPEPERYLERELVRRKGSDVVSRIAAHSETTPHSIRRQLEGMPALVSLYAAYRRTCDALVARSRLPVLELDAVTRDESAVRERVGSWLEAAVCG